MMTVRARPHDSRRPTPSPYQPQRRWQNTDRLSTDWAPKLRRDGRDGLVDETSAWARPLVWRQRATTQAAQDLKRWTAVKHFEQAKHGWKTGVEFERSRHADRARAQLRGKSRSRQQHAPRHRSRRQHPEPRRAKKRTSETSPHASALGNRNADADRRATQRARRPARQVIPTGQTTSIPPQRNRARASTAASDPRSRQPIWQWRPKVPECANDTHPHDRDRTANRASAEANSMSRIATATRDHSSKDPGQLPATHSACRRAAATTSQTSSRRSQAVATRPDRSYDSTPRGHERRARTRDRKTPPDSDTSPATRPSSLTARNTKDPTWPEPPELRYNIARPTGQNTSEDSYGTTRTHPSGTPCGIGRLAPDPSETTRERRTKMLAHMPRPATDPCGRWDHSITPTHTRARNRARKAWRQ